MYETINWVYEAERMKDEGWRIRDAPVRSNGVASLKVLSKREQSHACMFYAEREGLRPERSKSKQNYNKSTEYAEGIEGKELFSLTESSC